MKTLFFDCASGISGNMVLGALLELLGDEEYLLEELHKLPVNGYQIEITKKIKNGITGTHVNVIVDGEDEYGHVHHLAADRVEGAHDGHGHDTAEHTHHEHEHDTAEHAHHEHGHDAAEHGHYEHGHDAAEHGHHEHEHDAAEHGHHEHGHDTAEHAHHTHHHPHRNLQDVNRILDESTLDEETKALARRIFLRVAKAESKVHARPLEEVHFHEVGALDSIIDIAGCAILVNKIRPDRIFSSVVNDGYGFIQCAHGTMSVPVPATSEIFAEGRVRFRQIDVDTELVTPTGAAIIAELAEAFGAMPEMTAEKIGWGAGTKDLKIPNVLKVILGETKRNDENEKLDNQYKGSEPATDRIDEEQGAAEKIVVMETNIDDCNGELLGYTMERLFESGARDVFFTPVFMKKNRPAYRLTVVCMPEKMRMLQDIIFMETTTIGIRYRVENRRILSRESVELETRYGTVKAKKVKTRSGEFVYPEYESIRELAKKEQIPLKEFYRN